MRRSLPFPLFRLGCWSMVLGAALTAVQGATVIIQSRIELTNPSPAYAELAGNWQNSSVTSTAAGMTAGTGSRFATADGAACSVSPVLEEGHTYLVDVTHATSSNIPTDLMVGITQSGCTGLPDTTPEFSQTPANTWRRVGTIKVDAGVTTPTITFSKLAGATGAGQRFYADGFRFTDAGDPCLTGPPQLATVNGPLAAGQAFVHVPNVASNVVKVTVYANGVAIGQLTNGVVPGLNTVPTQPLVQGTQITVTQSGAANVESCRPTTGPVVGGGPNPALRLSLSIKQDVTLTGPIGTNAGTPTLPLFFLAATEPTAGFGTAPAGGKVIQPGPCWQTVTFERGPDPALPVDGGYFWSGATGTTLQGDFGILDAVALCMEATNSGPYRIYLDNLMNGDVVVQDFETTPSGTNALFMPPDFSGSTTPYLLSQPPGAISPNLTMVTNGIADTGTNSLVVHWQFKDEANGDWLRLVAQGPGTPNPQIDLRLPISVRLLLLPLGGTNADLSVTALGDRSLIVGETVVWSVVASGKGPFSYRWLYNGSVVSGQTGSSYTIANVQTTQAGVYTVEVSNGNCSTATSGTLQVFTSRPGPIQASLSAGRVTLTWPGSGVLESASVVTGGWTEVVGAASGYSVDVQGAAQQFFRLKN